MNFCGTLSVPVTVSDGTATSGVYPLSVSVSAVNDPPIAVNDAYVTDEDTMLTVPAQGVLMKVNPLNAEGLYGVGSSLYGDFGSGAGLYKYDGLSWTSVSAMDAQGMTGVGLDLYVDFGVNGLYRYTEGVLRNDTDV